MTRAEPLLIAVEDRSSPPAGGFVDLLRARLSERGLKVAVAKGELPRLGSSQSGSGASHKRAVMIWLATDLSDLGEGAAGTDAVVVEVSSEGPHVEDSLHFRWGHPGDDTSRLGTEMIEALERHRWIPRLSGYTQEEEEQIEERLRGLGYL